jgi:hypothetical protein
MQNTIWVVETPSSKQSWCYIVHNHLSLIFSVGGTYQIQTVYVETYDEQAKRVSQWPSTVGPIHAYGIEQKART